MIGTYIITHVDSGKFYIGSTINFKKRKQRHLKDLELGKHANVYLQRLFDKSNELLWEFNILNSEEEARSVEQCLLDEHFKTEQCLNLSPTSTGGDLISNHPKRADIVANIRNAVIARYATMSKVQKKTVYGKAGKANPMYGKAHTQRTKDILSEINKKRYSKLSKEERKRIYGRPCTEERKRKLSMERRDWIGDKNPFYGKRHSQETKDRLREKNLGKKPPNMKKVSINGTVYESLHEAGCKLDVPIPTVHYRCKSNSFPEWRVL